MKFAVKAWSKGSKARVGVLEFNNSSNCPLVIETPALLLSTRKGLPLFISADHLLSSFPSPYSHLLQCSPLHFLEGLTPKTISLVGGLHGMLGLSQHVFVALPRDSLISLPEHNSTNKIGASFETPCGRRLVKPMEYMEMISSMKPNIWVTLADEVPTWVSDHRNTSSVNRTLGWLDDCITSDLATTAGGAIFGSIVGGCKVEERRRCAQEVARRNVSGYWIGGFGLGESMDERAVLLDAVTDIVPDQKPRHISGLELPEEVLQGVAAGVDLFDSTYIHHLTLGGFALTFPLKRSEVHGSKCHSSDVDIGDTKINLKATTYRKDSSPIVDGCQCFTCQNHTKAYINHLFNVHEMLAQILLEIHNTYHFMGFFHSIREEITKGNFELFRQNFVSDRRGHLLHTAISV